MSRWIVLYRGEIINNLGGYSTRKGAVDSFMSFRTLGMACKYARSIGAKIGMEHALAVQQWFEDNLAVVEVSEISYITDNGRITKYLSDGS